ncbi:MAG: GNAT family N-acetyltransferase, partial [Ferruginibacter sp.]
MPIHYTPYHHIDKAKWDACIDAAANGLIYGGSIYLDTMSKNWDALILNDYEAVMPLTFKRKYGIYYLYQPFFTACLGVFGNNISASILEDFLAAIPAKFKYWDIYLNHGNYFQLKNFELYQRTNYVLDLNKPYEVIYAAYGDNIKRNIKKCLQLKCITKKNVGIDEVISLAQEQSKTFSPVTQEDFKNFKKLCQQLSAKQQAITYGIYTSADQLVASCALFLSHNRLYYILVGNHPNGRTIGASHALIDAFIKDYAGKNLILDFEGSDIRNLAFFYSSFGATEEKYAGIKLNRLPKLLQLV